MVYLPTLYTPSPYTLVAVRCSNTLSISIMSTLSLPYRYVDPFDQNKLAQCDQCQLVLDHAPRFHLVCTRIVCGACACGCPAADTAPSSFVAVPLRVQNALSNLKIVCEACNEQMLRVYWSRHQDVCVKAPRVIQDLQQQLPVHTYHR